jgi:hypothetical protein
MEDEESPMDFDILTGIILTATALGGVVILTLWSRHIIERIHSRAPTSLRKIRMVRLNGDEP